MPKPTLPLTDSQCKKLEPPNQLSDGGGLSLQARGNGKYWRFRYYRPSDNKRDEIRLGIYPAMSLKEAREEREELRGLVARGIDPKLYRQNEAQRQAEQMNNTFEAVARKWHADQAAKPDKWKPDHAGRVIRSLELHIFPNLARRQIGEIMPLEVLGLLQRLEAAGKHDTAHKVYDVVNQVFRYAVMLRLCIFNPAAELRGELAQVEQKHYRTITDPEKIGGLLRALDGYTGSPQTRALLQLSPYVFARPSELRLLRWCEIDWEARQYRKDGEEMKNGIGHIVPLSRQAIAILEGLKPVHPAPTLRMHTRRRLPHRHQNRQRGQYQRNPARMAFRPHPPNRQGHGRHRQPLPHHRMERPPHGRGQTSRRPGRRNRQRAGLAAAAILRLNHPIRQGEVTTCKPKAKTHTTP